MTSYDKEDIRCCCCGAHSGHTVLMSTNSFGHADLDQRPPGMMRDTMEAWLQECPSCGYVAPSIDQGGEADRAIVTDAEFQRLRSDTAYSGSTRRFLLRAALVARKGDWEDAFSKALCAAWTADDSASRAEQARELRIKAAAYVLGKDASLDTRLRLLDVLRRAADWDAASSLASELKSEALEHPFDRIIAFHADRIALHDDGPYTIHQALGEQKVA